jgi:hypothetical protein
VTQRGGDAESFGFFRVLAESEERALEWGHELSRWYTTLLWGDGGVHWARQWFAARIEHAPDNGLREAAAATSVIMVGEYPDFAATKAVFHD